MIVTCPHCQILGHGLTTEAKDNPTFLDLLELMYVTAVQKSLISVKIFLALQVINVTAMHENQLIGEMLDSLQIMYILNYYNPCNHTYSDINISSSSSLGGFTNGWILVQLQKT